MNSVNSNSNQPPPVVGYLSGPVDARKVYRAWRDEAHTELFGTSYLRHWFNEVEDQGRSGVVITSEAGEAYEETHGNFTILNRPKPTSSGLRYHMDMVRWTRERLSELEGAGARTVVMTDAPQYWFVTPPFRRRGMKFVNSFHCAIRSLGHSAFSPHELLIRASASVHMANGDPSMVIVEPILDELRAMPGSDRRDTFLLRPDYKEKMFADFGPPSIAEGGREEVRVIFAGRVTRNKGVFDLLEMAERLSLREGPRVHFDIHGTGSDLDELRAEIARRNLEALVTVHGFTAGAQLLDHYRDADIVIVPTRSDFEEGVAKSVIEGVLTLRPVVTSQACPSIRVVGDACFEAEVDNPSSYAEAIWKLANNPELVREKVDAARGLRKLFFDPPERYDRQLRKALAVAESGA
ncbi:glycosyltransferase family 4 protein [Qipengyuania vesicularis]|uniref:glycosyltransferase family 4 protein n=1 Tax=Qipengyuania vesicularis TaxID=2867232 RepID=UPI001C88A36C|nr:glycosyltransferase family 4 protein [Qipengyuania vesicularis]